jgi:two-component system cell cycle response regulator
VVRTALLFYENQRMISRIHIEARTDPLTGLRNRRSLMYDLAAELELATLEQPRAIVLFDLDGFKEYNDAFGHPAGDGLLERLGMRLADAVLGHGRAYRLGGDEFCVLLRPSADGLEPLALACVAALSERGEGFDVTTSHGAVLAPSEARTATEALQLADRRMYARKGSRRLSAGSQSRDVLMRTLSETRPDLHAHLRGTAKLATAVGRELGMRPDALDEVARAATTWARWQSRTRSWRRRGRSTTPSGPSCGATRSSASGSCWRPRSYGRPRGWCGQATSAGTAAATRTAWPAKTSRSARGWWPPATPTTR